jgi:hypothetical protein
VLPATTVYGLATNAVPATSGPAAAASGFRVLGDRPQRPIEPGRSPGAGYDQQQPQHPYG